VKCVQTNGAAASGPGDGSSGDEHPDSTHKKVKVSKGPFTLRTTCAKGRTSSSVNRVDERQRALTDVDARRRPSPHIDGYIQYM